MTGLSDIINMLYYQCLVTLYIVERKPYIKELTRASLSYSCLCYTFLLKLYLFPYNTPVLSLLFWIKCGQGWNNACHIRWLIVFLNVYFLL